MIKKINSINFKSRSSLYEQKGFASASATNTIKQDELITETLENNINDNYQKGRLFDKFAAVYEKAGNPQIANSLYKNAAYLKENSQAPIFEVFKSYIGIQKTYKDIGDDTSANDIENMLIQRIKTVGDIKKNILSPEETYIETMSFIQVALKVCKNLIDNNQFKIATEIFNTIEENIKKDDLNSDKLGIIYKKVKAEILEKNNSFDEAITIYKDLVQKDNNNDYIYKIIANKLSNNDNKDLETLLNKTFNASQSPENILKNLFYRATYQLNNGNNDYAIKYLNLADTISTHTDSDIKPDLNILIALMLSQNNDYEKSSELCIKTLDLLKSQNKVQTPEFVKVLSLLAFNNFSQSLNTNDKSKLTVAKNIYQNAYTIAKAINDSYSITLVMSEMAEVTLSEGEYQKAIKFAESTIRNTEENSFKAKAYSVLGKVARKQTPPNSHLALEYFENERKYLITGNAPLHLIKENAQNIIDIYKDFGKMDKVEEYTKILLDKGSARYQDLMELGNSKIRAKEFAEAQKYFEQAATLENEDDSAKAIARVHAGIAKLETLNDKKAIADIEKGCSKLETIAKNSNYENAKETKNLIDILNFVGDFYYFRKNKYDRAADIFAKIVQISKDQTSVSLTDDFIKKSKLKAGASLYKTGKYDEALPYYMGILRNMTENDDLTIDSLNEKFVANILETKNRKDCSKIANALEIIGVINTKAERFVSAKICFETAKAIREDAGGNKLLLAKNYMSLARLDMINNFSGSKPKIEKAIALMKSELGAKSDAVIKEQKFLENYFGNNITSYSKYIPRALGEVKGFLGFENNFKQEILKDFHIIYEDLALCE